MTHIIALIQQYGLAFVFLNVLAVQAGLPIPAYPTLIVAGAYATGAHSIAALIGAGVAGAVIADAGWYLAGRRFGMSILGMLCRMSLSKDSCVRQTESIFQRFGPASMLVAKFVPGFASVATALAGALRLRYLVFALFDTLGAALWVGVGVALGYIFRDAINGVLGKLAVLGRGGGTIVAVAIVVWILIKWWRRHLFVMRLRMDRVSVHELHTLIEAHKVAAILDVRSPLSQQATGLIPGSRTVDIEHIDEGIDGLSPDGEVVVYCACPNEASAVEVAQKLMKLGFKRIRPLRGGIDAWIEAGFEVERAPAGATVDR
jgi:membrane protein DedA with SNARE-associated domain/rhodanese-related sulfurtransferase